jgi:hypothetical protein
MYVKLSSIDVEQIIILIDAIRQRFIVSVSTTESRDQKFLTSRCTQFCCFETRDEEIISSSVLKRRFVHYNQHQLLAMF